MIAESEAWRSIRASRSTRPASLTNGARRRAFTSGLEQAEQMWVAAKSVGVIASPIVMYYALTQAGRALAAASVKDVFDRAASGHGLGIDLDGQSPTTLLSMASTYVTEKGRGQVQSIAEVLDSPLLGRRASMAELTCSLNVADHLRFGDGFPSPLIAYAAIPTHVPARPRISIWNVPRVMVQRARHSDTNANRDEVWEGLTRTETTRWLDNYPRLSQLGAPGSQPAITTPSSEITTPLRVIEDCDIWELEWDNCWNSDENETAQRTWFYDRFGTLSPRGQMNEFKIDLVPRVGDNTAEQDRLVTWWLVLYAFSILARYHPERWVRLIDIDASSDAVIVESLMEAARIEIPSLIDKAMRRVSN